MNSSENQVKRLTVDDIEVPDGMLDAYVQAGLRAGFQITLGQMDRRRKCFAAALLWLAENPTVPSGEELDQIWHGMPLSTESYPYFGKMRGVFSEAQRRMFLRKQEELPDEVKKLIDEPFDSSSFSAMFAGRILAAYKLGKEGK